MQCNVMYFLLFLSPLKQPHKDTQINNNKKHTTMKNAKTITAASKLIGKIIEPENWREWVADQRMGYSVSAYLINGLKLEPDGQIVMLALRKEIASSCTSLDPSIYQDEIRDLKIYQECSWLIDANFR